MLLRTFVLNVTVFSFLELWKAFLSIFVSICANRNFFEFGHAFECFRSDSSYFIGNAVNFNGRRDAYGGCRLLLGGLDKLVIVTVP